MEQALHTATATRLALQHKMKATANNLANANNAGWRRDEVIVSETRPQKTFYDTLSFPTPYKTHHDTRPGEIVPTNNTYDLALDGSGYFALQSPNGQVKYTRDGRFKLNTEGVITAADGSVLLSQNNAPMAVPLGTRNVTVTKEGNVFADDELIDQVGAFDLDINQGRKTTGNAFITNEAVVPALNTTIYQGYYEGSNVQSVLEVTSLVDIQRADDQAMFVIKSYQENSEQAANDLLYNHQG